MGIPKYKESVIDSGRNFGLRVEGEISPQSQHYFSSANVRETMEKLDHFEYIVFENDQVPEQFLFWHDGYKVAHSTQGRRKNDGMFSIPLHMDGYYVGLVTGKYRVKLGVIHLSPSETLLKAGEIPTTVIGKKDEVMPIVARQLEGFVEEIVSEGWTDRALESLSDAEILDHMLGNYKNFAAASFIKKESPPDIHLLGDSVVGANALFRHYNDLGVQDFATALIIFEEAIGLFHELDAVKQFMVDYYGALEGVIREYVVADTRSVAIKDCAGTMHGRRVHAATPTLTTVRRNVL